MTTLYAVRTSAHPGREADFERWYDEVHLPEVLAIPGFVGARRFRLSEHQVFPAERHASLALYEIDDDDIPGTLQRLLAATHLQQSDALDPASIDVAVYEAAGPRRISE